MGEISHIKASQPGGPRHDQSQTDEQRNGFDNLLLLCPTHHKVVDDDPESYTVERLVKMKMQHEAAQPAVAEPSDAIAGRLVANIRAGTVVDGSIILTLNQMGGQIAHSIQNVGPQPRRFSQAAADALVADLLKHPAETIQLSCILGDVEGFQFASALKSTLELGGWRVSGIDQVVYSVPVMGIHIETPAVRPGLVALLEWFRDSGVRAQGSQIAAAQGVMLIVGANA